MGQEARGAITRSSREIEAAHERREIALELLGGEEEKVPRFRLQASLDDEPDAVAAKIRRSLAVDLDFQFAFADDRIGFNTWRAAIEDLDVLVLQMTDVDRHEARGFSIAERSLPVVVANNEDPFSARSFTIVHELTHVLIHTSGICDLRDAGRIEPFCNHIAGAVLVPQQSLLGEQVVREHGSEVVWEDDELQRLARRFSVSREVILRRLRSSVEQISRSTDRSDVSYSTNTNDAPPEPLARLTGDHHRDDSHHPRGSLLLSACPEQLLAWHDHRERRRHVSRRPHETRPSIQRAVFGARR